MQTHPMQPPFVTNQMGQPGQPMSPMDQIFAYDALTVQQTTKGCLQECLGCEAQSEFYIYGGHLEEGQAAQKGVNNVGYIIEKSSCLSRCCITACLGPPARPFKMPLTTGSATVPGVQVAEFQKDCSCPTVFVIRTDNGNLPVCCCCMLPSVKAVAADGRPLGSTKYLCEVASCGCVPAYKVYDAQGREQFYVKPNVCCGGICIACKCSGGPQSKCLYIPFYIRDPSTKQPVPSNIINRPSQIAKVWSGMKKECCTDADNYHIIFPAGSNADTRANLLGTTMLIDLTYFETQN